jgi:hypothetical protein
MQRCHQTRSSIPSITTNNVKVKTLHLVGRRQPLKEQTMNNKYEVIMGVPSPSMVTPPIRKKVRVK